jgi:hypothetical protein
MNHYAKLLVEMGVSQTICLGWPQTTVLLISQVAKTTGMSHQHPTRFKKKNFNIRLETTTGKHFKINT